MDSIIVKITNGLGNQMYQYGLGRHLSLLNNCPLKFDLSRYNNENKDPFGIDLNLDKFNIVGENIAEKEIEFLIPTQKRINNKYLRFLSTKYRLYISKHNFYKKNYIKDEWNGNLNILKAKPPVYLDGGWFSFNYTNDIRDVLIKDFSIKDELRNEYFVGLLEKIKSSKNSVGIHFRRKYAEKERLRNFWNVLDLDYFYNGIKLLDQKYHNLQLFIFADDIEWVKNNFNPNHNTTFIERSEYLTDAHDWELLKTCKHQIISNSTFSLWAAYLNSNTDQLVILPKIWFKEPKRQRRYEKSKPILRNGIKI